MSYESDTLRSIYLSFHYGTRGDHEAGFDIAALPEDGFRFAEATVELFEKTGADSEHSGLRALDIGCAVGRSTFELSKACDEVIGIDFSSSFIEMAEQIRSGQAVEYMHFGEQHEGGRSTNQTLTAGIPEGARPEKVSFEQGDAMNLRADLGAFDWVHAANLLCRLPEPTKFLKRLPDLVKPGGQLITATPCSWLEEYTPLENQPTGTTQEFLDEHLDDYFEKQGVTEVPFVIREHARKYQVSTSQTIVWHRKE